MENGKFQIGLAGDPNCGKSTLFSGLTGTRQHIGNWPGVTVEKKEGEFRLPNGTDVSIVDLPGVYSLDARSEDEQATVSYLQSGTCDLILNVIDATAIERNLYLTTLLAERGVPMVVVITMMDIARKRDIDIELHHLHDHLGVPVIGINAHNKHDLKLLARQIQKAMKDPRIPHLADLPHILTKDEAAVEAKKKTGLEVDEIMATSRYRAIDKLCHEVVWRRGERHSVTDAIDRVMLNRILGIPIFLAMMFLVFWLTQTIGGAFIDFFDRLGATVFVDGSRVLLEKCSSPGWLISLLSGGIGAGLQTILTFIPPISFMFFFLAILEDSGYMSRAAFVMDRFMRWIGLPGKSFVPMLVGFGCSVPAIMATRTLESRRDRMLTVFMTPFFSCGAKLPVYVVFGAAFFAGAPGRMVFWIYLAGIALGVLTGLVLKHTLFRGEPSTFIMELPPYHVPQMINVVAHTWDRLKIFLFRASKVILPMVLLLGFLNQMGRDGSFGNENSENSLLSSVGKATTPVFRPMGIEDHNWPATVAIFTGLFAKESVISTMTSLYGQMEEGEKDQQSRHLQQDQQSQQGQQGQHRQFPGYSLWGGIKDALKTIPHNLARVARGVAAPFRVGAPPAGADHSTAEEAAEDTSVFRAMRNHFSEGPNQAFAYLLFILLYMPCLAATATAFRELGKVYGTMFIVYLTALGWCTATLYYQVTLGHHLGWIGAAVGILAAMVAAFWAYGRKHKIAML